MKVDLPLSITTLSLLSIISSSTKQLPSQDLTLVTLNLNPLMHIGVLITTSTDCLELECEMSTIAISDGISCSFSF